MPLGTLPYKAKITQANADMDQGRNLIITIYDGSANVLRTTSIDVQDPTLQNIADVVNITHTMQAELIQQLIQDAGDVGIGLDAFSLVAGG